MDQLDISVTPKKSVISRATTAGLYIAAATIVLGLIEYVTGINKVLLTNTPLSLLNSLVMLVITAYFIHTAIRLYRDQDNGSYLTLGNGIGLGTLAGLVAGIISAVWTVIFMQFIAPDLVDTIKQVQMEKMQEQGQSEEQIEQLMAMSSFAFSPPFMAVIVALSSVFFGFLCGLISGLVLKRERPYA